MNTLTVCINAFEKSNLFRLAMSLVSLFYTCKTTDKIYLRDAYYKLIEKQSFQNNLLAYAEKALVELLKFEKDDIPNNFLNQHIKLMFIVDVATENPNLKVVSLFKEFCRRYNIENYEIFIAKHNYRIQVMRNVSFRNCTTDYMMWADDDDLQGISVYRKLKHIKNLNINRNPKTTAIRISFHNVLLLRRNNRIVDFDHEISGMWSKIYSQYLCKYAYHVPSVSGGEDWLTNRKIIGDVIKPIESKRENFVEKEIVVSPNFSYIWFPSERNVNVGMLQNEMAIMHSFRNHYSFNKSISEYSKKKTANDIQRRVNKEEKKVSKDRRDIIYHEDEVIELYHEDSSGNNYYQNMFISPRIQFNNKIPPRNVKLENENVVVIDSAHVKYPWMKHKMSVDYWNSHLKNIPYIEFM